MTSKQIGDNNDKKEVATTTTTSPKLATTKWRDHLKMLSTCGPLLGICVRTSLFQGRPYSIILHREHGELAVEAVKISPSTWVNFTMSDQEFFVECSFKPKINEVVEVDPKRAVFILPESRTFQVMSFIHSREFIFNDDFFLCMDALLGAVLVSKFDDYVNQAFKEERQLEFAVVYQRNIAKGRHWVAIAVNEKTTKIEAEGNDDGGFRILKGLPPDINKIAESRYEVPLMPPASVKLAASSRSRYYAELP